MFHADAMMLNEVLTFSDYRHSIYHPDVAEVSFKPQHNYQGFVGQKIPPGETLGNIPPDIYQYPGPQKSHGDLPKTGTGEGPGGKISRGDENPSFSKRLLFAPGNSGASLGK